ncbi:MAG TPA: hypothetical protein VLT13_10615 [Bacteroidota bacterium]|nr:hypothetical protein [Bacteroidota bacterium]
MDVVQIIQIVVGVALLAFGRKGLGLFLGAIGFFAGISLVNHFFPTASQGLLFAVALAGGVLGMFIAFFIKKVAVGAAGLLGGGYIGYLVGVNFGWDQQGFPWIPVLICGVIGIVLAFFLIKWALIILSSVLGAFLVVQALNINPAFGTIIFFVLLAGGILFQLRSGKSQQSGGAG